MNRMSGLVLAGAVVVATAAVASSKTENEIVAATEAHFVALNTNDIEAHLKHHAGVKTSFGFEGDSLRVFQSIAEQRTLMTPERMSAFKSDQRPEEVRVQLHGNVAVVTCYVTGTVTVGSEAPHPVRERRTAVLVKEGRDWKEVHLHSSPLAR